MSLRCPSVLSDEQGRKTSSVLGRNVIKGPDWVFSVDESRGRTERGDRFGSDDRASSGGGRERERDREREREREREMREGLGCRRFVAVQISVGLYPVGTFTVGMFALSECSQSEC